MRTLVMYTFAAFSTLVALAPPAMSAGTDNATARTSLVGSWVQRGGSGAWIFDSVGDGLHITRIEGSGVVADFRCNTEGQSCDVKIAGHKATVSLYYNGSALVQLETRGDQIIKRRFSVLPSGDSMKVEVIPMSGNHIETQELEFGRGQPPPRKE